MGLFSRKIKVTFIDKEWNRIKENVKIGSVPKSNELIYFGEGEVYYRVSQVIYWPNHKSDIFIVVESLFDIEKKYTSISDKLNYDNKEKT